MLKNQTILIVDDEKSNINILVDLLESDYFLSIAKSGEQALRIAFSDNPPDLILLDIMMPVMDGYEVCKRLKNSDETKDIPVIFITAIEGFEDEIKALQMGAVDFITKPVVPSTVMARVKNHLMLRETTQNLTKAYIQLQSKNNLLMQSIHFASIIQQSILPQNDLFKELLPKSEIVWRPKDIIGGDIYVVNDFEDKFILSVIDCTGHGVAGALMSMVSKLVFDTIAQKNYDYPSQILQELNKNIMKTLSQDKDDSKGDSGLDCGVLFYDKSNHTIKYSGAKTPLFYTQNKEFFEIKPDRQSIGYKKSKLDFEFTDHVLQLAKSDRVYISTDGIFDQNNTKSICFSRRIFKEIIANNLDVSVEDQVAKVMLELKTFQEDEPQTDDITLIAFEIT